MRRPFVDRRYIYATVAVVIAPAATIRLVALAIEWGLLAATQGLGLLVAAPLAGALALVAVAWRHGCTGRDPLDRFRTRQTIREELPEQYHDALSAATLDEPASEGVVPTSLFLFGLCYAVTVPVVSLAVMLRYGLL